MNLKDILFFYFKHTRGYRKHLLMFFVITFFMSFESSFFNYSISYLIGKLSKGHLDYNFSFFISSIIFISGLLFFELLYVFDKLITSKTFPYINKNILISVYNKIQNMPFVFFKKNTTGEIISRISLLRDNFDDLIFDLGHGTFKEVFKVIISLLSIFTIEIKIGIITTIWCIFFIIVMYNISIKITKNTCEQYKAGHWISGKITDRLINIFSIFSFSTFKKEKIGLENEYTKEFIPKELKTYKYKIQLFAYGGFLYLIILVYIFYYTIYLKNKNEITIEKAAFIIQQFLVMSRTLWYINDYIQDVLHELSSLKTIMDFFYNKENDNILKENLPNLKLSNTAKIEFKNVSFNYNGNNFDTLKNFNLKIAEKEKIGIVGRSGVGKTSILYLLLGLFKCSSGEILINDTNINMINIESLRKQISIIPQETILFNRSILDNIKYGCQNNVKDEEIYNICEKINLHKKIMSLPEGYNTIVGERGTKLSGGERQRISIARAFLRKTPILLLDEMTSALDTSTEISVLESLNVLIKDLEPTVISIAHRLSTIKEMDRNIVLEQGEIIEEGTHENLIKNSNSLYSKLWSKQKNAFYEKVTNDNNINNNN